MRSLCIGAALALLVSMAPGANTALCLRMARRRTGDAAALIAAAALTDCCYAALCSLGVLRAVHLDPVLIAWGSAALLALAALLVWPAGERVRPLGAGAVALLNPATAALWVGMSATVIPVEHAHQIHPVAIAIGALLATAGWFLTLSYLSSHLVGKLLTHKRVGQCLSLALLALAAFHAFGHFWS